MRHIQKHHPSDHNYNNSYPEVCNIAILENTGLDTPVLKPKLGQKETNSLEYMAGRFLCELKTNTSLTEVAINKFADMCNELCNKVVDVSMKHFELFLKEKNISISEADRDNMTAKCFLGNIFENVKTRNKQIKFINKFISHVEPEEVMLGNRVDTGIRGTDSCLKNINETFMYVPIIPTLKNIFQKASVRKLVSDETPSTNLDFFRTYGWDSI